VCKVSLDIPAEKQPQLHNRWHPDVPFAGTIKNGETVKIECVSLLLSEDPTAAHLTNRSIGLGDKSVNTLSIRQLPASHLVSGNNDSADDMKNVDLTKIHYLSGPFEIETAEPGDVLLVEIMDVQPFEDSPWGL